MAPRELACAALLLRPGSGKADALQLLVCTGFPMSGYAVSDRRYHLSHLPIPTGIWTPALLGSSLKPQTKTEEHTHSRELGTSEGTVKVHRHNIWQRLGIAGNAELFRLFINYLVKNS